MVVLFDDVDYKGDALVLKSTEMNLDSFIYNIKLLKSFQIYGIKKFLYVSAF